MNQSEQSEQPNSTQEEQSSEMDNNATQAETPIKELNQWAMFTHLSGILLGFLGPIIIWIIQKDKMPQLESHYKSALNFQLVLLIAYAVCGVLCLVLIGFLLLPVVYIAGIILAIMTGIKANEGQPCKYPFTIEFIK